MIGKLISGPRLLLLPLALFSTSLNTLSPQIQGFLPLAAAALAQDPQVSYSPDSPTPTPEESACEHNQCSPTPELSNNINDSPAMSAIKKFSKATLPLRAFDPFVFCAYHRDDYPEGDGKMQAPRMGNGSDFNPDAPYRMYHGDRIPGFPQHPHRGFETLTAVLEGTIDHTDSLGGSGRFSSGDLQWMSAGRGIVHGENFPLVHTDKPNTLRMFQIWLNLPQKAKMTTPSYVMNWSEDKTVLQGENGADLILFAGTLNGKTGGKAPPQSWGANPANDVGVFYLTVPPGGSFTLPAANTTLPESNPSGSPPNRLAYVAEGEDGCLFDDQAIPLGFEVELDSTKPVRISVPADKKTTCNILVLQGKPLNEPIATHGPFVMNNQQEIREAFMDYQRTRFGGWPWKEDAVVFDSKMPRFAGRQNEPNEYPPGYVPNGTEEGMKNIHARKV